MYFIYQVLHFYLRFLKELLNNVLKGLNARLHLEEKSAEEQQALKKNHTENLKKMKAECDEVNYVFKFKKMKQRLFLFISEEKKLTFLLIV